MVNRPALERVLLQFAVIVAACGANVAFAQTNLWCEGTVARLTVDAGGDVLVYPSWRNDYVRVCNVTQNVGTAVSAPICLTWISLLRNAVQRSAQTTLMYSGANVPASCAQMPTSTYQNAPVPQYVMLVN